MKLNTSTRKGFTLVEIMIVVVIIGLLAALAIPAFKKVRNSAIEKSLINDGKQIASAAQQFMSENASTYATAQQIAPFLAGNKISSGVAASAASASIAFTQAIAPNTNWSTAGNAIIVQQGSYFTLAHPNFDASLSSNALAVGTTTTQGSSTGRSTITFTDSGTVNQ